MAGTTRRMSMPARAAIAKAASVQAAKVIQRIKRMMAASGPYWPSAIIGWWYQENSTLNDQVTR